MSAITWALVVLGVMLNAAAQLLLKSATVVTGPIALSWTSVSSAAPQVLSHYGWWCGLTCYAVSVLIWVLALSRAPVSVVYPLLSLGYIVNAVGAALLFGEPLLPTKMLGIVVIIVGVYILTQSSA
jgi:multidrug transporter EmrE-like cation transporter